MQPENCIKRLSLKSRIIFFVVIPMVILVFIEITTRITLDCIEKFKTKRPAALQNISKENVVLQNNYKELSGGKQMFYIPIHKYDRDLFWRPRSNISFPFMLPNGVIIKYELNSLGLRGKEISVKKEKDALRILCIGDSSTFGYLVKQSDTYEQRLEKFLSDLKPSKRIEVINAGVIGYASYQGRKLFEKSLRNLNPDILIFSYGLNDSRMNILPDSKMKLEPIFLLEARRLLPKLTIFNLIRDGLHNLRRRFMSRDINSRARKTIALYPRVSLTEYKENLERISAICKEDRISLILLPISVPMPYYEVMKEVAIDQEIGFIDIEEAFELYYKKISENDADVSCGLILENPEDLDLSELYGSEDMARRRKCNYLFMDYCHPTPCGHMIIADKIFDFLEEHSFLKE
jgi:lysophospholipase L1-like esterase